jgi:hypothetical protein
VQGRQVANLRLVRNAAERDDGPILEFEWRDLSKLRFRPRQIADDEPAPCLPELLILSQPTHVAQSLRHDPAGRGRHVDPDPLALENLGCRDGRTAAAESVKHNVVLVAAGFDDAIQ